MKVNTIVNKEYINQAVHNAVEMLKGNQRKSNFIECDGFKISDKASEHDLKNYMMLNKVSVNNEDELKQAIIDTPVLGNTVGKVMTGFNSSYRYIIAKENESLPLYAEPITGFAHDDSICAIEEIEGFNQIKDCIKEFINFYKSKEHGQSFSYPIVLLEPHRKRETAYESPTYLFEVIFADELLGFKLNGSYESIEQKLYEHCFYSVIFSMIVNELYKVGIYVSYGLNISTINKCSILFDDSFSFANLDISLIQIKND